MVIRYCRQYQQQRKQEKHCRRFCATTVVACVGFSSSEISSSNVLLGTDRFERKILLEQVYHYVRLTYRYHQGRWRPVAPKAHTFRQSNPVLFVVLRYQRVLLTTRQATGLRWDAVPYSSSTLQQSVPLVGYMAMSAFLPMTSQLCNSSSYCEACNVPRSSPPLPFESSRHSRQRPSSS